MKFFSKLGKKFPIKTIATVRQTLDYADLKISAEEWIGRHVSVGLVLSIIFSSVVFSYLANPLYALLAIPTTIFIYYFLISAITGLMAEQRVRNVETILPDILVLMSSNLKSGIPADEAMISSAREEFGFFSEKIKMVGKKISTGVPISSAILELSKGLNSPVLDKTMYLILEGLESGGELSTILEETAADIRDTQILQKEIRSIIFVYALFIFIAAIIIAPVLYSVSTHLAGTLTRLSGEVSVTFLSRGTDAPLPAITSDPISQEFLVNFAYVNLLITAVFGSMMVSLITRGNEKYGIKYMPIFIAVALAIFFIARVIIGGFFQAIRI